MATLAEYRHAWYQWAGELGLSRSARERLAPRQPTDDEADIFDG